MKLSKLLLVTSWYLIDYLEVTKCATINDSNILLEDMLKGYNRRVRPVADQHSPVTVNVSLFLKSIQQLDEVHGIFSIFAALLINWEDVRLVWNSSFYGEIEDIHLTYEDIWVPELILLSPAEELDSLGKKWHTVHFNSDGSALWSAAALIKSTCYVDMRNYPFDTQLCTVSFTVWGYSADEVKLQSPDSYVQLPFYDGNSIWTLKNTIIKTEESKIDFLFYLERKSGFIIVNVVLPLTFLSLLNAFVFLLVPESGERISYCITVLLSIAVFMTIVSDTLPRSSEPIPVISFKLLFDLINSALITLITIFNMRLYNKKDMNTVPRWLQKVYITLACKRQKNKIIPNAYTDQHRPGKIDLHAGKCDDEVKLERNRIQEKILIEEADADVVKITWEQINSMVDYFAFVAFALLSFLSFVLFIVSTQ